MNIIKSTMIARQIIKSVINYRDNNPFIFSHDYHEIIKTIIISVIIRKYYKQKIHLSPKFIAKNQFITIPATLAIFIDNYVTLTNTTKIMDCLNGINNAKLFVIIKLTAKLQTYFNYLQPHSQMSEFKIQTSPINKTKKYFINHNQFMNLFDNFYISKINLNNTLDIRNNIGNVYIRTVSCYTLEKIQLKYKNKINNDNEHYYAVYLERLPKHIIIFKKCNRGFYHIRTIDIPSKHFFEQT